MIKSKEYAVLKYLLDGIVHCHDFKNFILPSEIKMVKSLKLSRTTVRRALQRLEALNLICRQPGIGTTLLRPISDWEAKKILNDTEEDISNRTFFPPVDNVILAQHSYRIILFHEMHDENQNLLKIQNGICSAASLRNHKIEVLHFRKYMDHPDLSWSEAVSNNNADAMIIAAALSAEEFARIRCLGKIYLALSAEHPENNCLLQNMNLNCEYAVHQFIIRGHKRAGILDFIPDNQPERLNNAFGVVLGLQKSMPQLERLYYCNRPKTIASFLKSHPDVTALYCSEDHKLDELLLAAEKTGRKPGIDLEIIVQSNAEISHNIPAYIGQIQNNWFNIGAWALKLVEQMLDSGARVFPPINLAGLYIPQQSH